MRLSRGEIIFKEASIILSAGLLGGIVSDVIIFNHSRIHSILAIAALSTLASRITDIYFGQKISEPVHPFARQEKWKQRLASTFIIALTSSVIAAKYIIKDHLLDSKGILIFAVIITTVKYVCALFPNSLLYDTPLRQTLRKTLKLKKKNEHLRAELKILKEEEERRVAEIARLNQVQSQAVNLQNALAKKSGKLAWMNLF